MKTNKMKKWLAAILTPLFGVAISNAIAGAIVIIVFTICVVVVAGILVYQIYKLAQKLNDPVKSGTVVDISQYFDSDYEGGYRVYSDLVTNVIAAAARPSEPNTYNATDSTFSMQYVISSVNPTNGPVGKLFTVCNSQINSFIDETTLNENGWYAGDYNVTFMTPGHLLLGTYSLDTHEFVVTVLNTNSATYNVVIERLTDNLSDWQPVYTNAICQVYSVENYTDTTATANKAFYRLKISSTPN